MTEQSTKDKPKTHRLSHQLSLNCALRNLAGFADRAEVVDSAQSQTRDGFSFDVIGKSLLQTSYPMALSEQKYRDTQSSHPATQERHPELVSGSAPNNRNAAGTEIGTRYRYIDDTPLVPLSEAAAGGGSSAAAGGAKTRSRPNNEYVLYSYGEPVGMTNDSGTSYFGTDILGSVRNVTDKSGTVQADYSYDAFGSPYLGNLENDIGFGYCGKVYDNGTGLYDYGFRDYSPVSARFTTIDPIRDGSNWFSYVVNDPVNYVDPFGLKSNDVKNYEYLGEWGGEKHYKAKSGATKWGLAHDTGHDVKDVKGYDGDPTKMPIGTELSIPSNSGSTPSESTQITATPPSNAQTTVGTTNAVVTQPSAPAAVANAVSKQGAKSPSEHAAAMPWIPVAQEIANGTFNQPMIKPGNSYQQNQVVMTDASKTAFINLNKSKSTFETWKNKPEGAELTERENNFQKIVGITEMGFGFAGIFFSKGLAVKNGAIVMADGAIVFGKTAENKKCMPFLHIFLDFLPPVVETDDGDVIAIP